MTVWRGGLLDLPAHWLLLLAHATIVAATAREGKAGFFSN
jgi:hypothetical protein